MSNKKIAVCLLSGGLDSTTALAIALSGNREVYALSVSYGQRHSKELESAKKVCEHYAVPLVVVRTELPWGGSALLDKDNSAVPTSRSLEEMSGSIPATYVPFRNAMMLGLAGSFAESIGASEIYIGVNALDYSGYPDCRPEFVDAFNQVLRLGTVCGIKGNAIRIMSPLVNKSKKQIVEKALELSAPVELTWSCYKGEEKACGECDSCLLRLAGFKENGMMDPAMERTA